MSKGVARATVDKAGTGIILTGAATVFVNGKPMVRIGDKVAPHGSGQHSAAIIKEGSSTVFAEGKAVARQGDKATCDHPITPGSSDVFAG